MQQKDCTYPLCQAAPYPFQPSSPSCLPRPFLAPGYGGGGTAFGDLWVLHLGADGGLRWEEATLAGRPPAPRFDHTAVALTMAPNSPHPDKLVVLGGRDSTQSFTDVHVLDLKSMTWLGGHGVPPLHGEVRPGRRREGDVGGCARICALNDAHMQQVCVKYGLRQAQWSCLF